MPGGSYDRFWAPIIMSRACCSIAGILEHAPPKRIAIEATVGVHDSFFFRTNVVTDQQDGVLG
jgi:hypothetical protein